MATARVRPGRGKRLLQFLLAGLGALLVTLALFLVLPFMQTISAPPSRDLLVRNLDASDLEPPPPPPMEEPEPEEAEPEEAPPELNELVEPLDLSQLELALNPGMGGGDGAFADMTGKLAAQAAAMAGGGGDEVFSLSELDQKPRIVMQTPPVYPQELRRKKVQGTVTVSFIVSKDGRVTNPKVEKSTEPLFEKPALDAVKQWRFDPGTRNGEKVQFKMRVPITFSAS